MFNSDKCPHKIEFQNEDSQLIINFHDNQFISGIGKFQVGKNPRSFSFTGLFSEKLGDVEVGLTTNDPVIIALYGVIKLDCLHLNCLLKHFNARPELSCTEIRLYSPTIQTSLRSDSKNTLKTVLSNSLTG
jgi:hypothetical protein